PQSLRHGPFIPRMDIIRFPAVDYYSLTCVWQRKSHGLRFPQFCPIAVFGFFYRLFKVGQLYPKKWKIPLSPFFTPILDHQREYLAVLVCTTSIGFTLIPECSFDAKRNYWFQHAMVKTGGPTIGTFVFRLLEISFATLLV